MQFYHFISGNQDKNSTGLINSDW